MAKKTSRACALFTNKSSLGSDRTATTGGAGSASASLMRDGTSTGLAGVAASGTAKSARMVSPALGMRKGRSAAQPASKVAPMARHKHDKEPAGGQAAGLGRVR